MTPEGKIKEKVKKLLVEHGAYFFMPVQTGYGKRTLDFLCCIKGRFVAIETKRPGGIPTKLQDIIASEISDAGGVTFVIDSDLMLEALDRWLARVA